jgi:ABC-2 type transport system ATP-binding protein
MRVPADETQLERTGLGHARDRRTGGFSHGMRQRLGLACALLGKPDLLVLDEPQNGLDPHGLRTIREILREENARGATVLVSVHRLAEVEGLCTHAALIVSGRAVRAGPVDRLLEGKEPRYRMLAGDTDAARRAIGAPCEVADGALVFRADREEAAAAAAACVRAGVKVFSLEPLKRTLDELYLDEIGGAGGP